MSIEELENKHGDIPLEPLNFDEFYYKKHTKLSVEYAISVLEELNKLYETLPGKRDAWYYIQHNNLKIQELKQYLNE